MWRTADAGRRDRRVPARTLRRTGRSDVHGIVGDEGPAFLFLLRSLGGGGAEVAAVRLAGWLATHGHRVTIATLYDEPTLQPAPQVRTITSAKRSRYDLVG